MELNPTVPQHNFVQSSAKFPAFVGGFGSGKTEALIMRRILTAIKYPGNNFAFYEPTFDLIRMIAWPRFEAFLSDLSLPYRLIKHPVNELTIEGYGKIIFRSMDTPSRIIGYEVADSDLDELDTLKRDDAAYVWRQALARNRQKKPDGSSNTMAVATTPEGFRFVYEAWEANPQPGYKIYRAPTSSNTYLPDDYIETLRAIYPEHLLDAYLEGQFVNLTSGSVYRNYDRARCNSNETIREKEPLFIGQDFNVGEMASCIYVKRETGWHCVAELHGLLDTPDVIRMIKDKYAGHKIYMYPDASGKARKSVGASTSDISLFKQAGFIVRARASNPLVKDRVLAVNTALSKGELWVNAKTCPETAKCLEQQAYDKNGEPDKKSGVDHQNDAFGYPIAYEMPVNKPIVQSVKIAGLY